MIISILFTIHVLVAASLVAVVLMQQSEGGALGIGGGGAGGMMSSRSAATFMTRLTMILGGLFFILSISLAVAANLTGQEQSAGQEAEQLDQQIPVEEEEPVLPETDG